MQYWSNVLHILRKKVGAEVIVTAVPGCVFRTLRHLFIQVRLTIEPYPEQGL